jgi:hypothetical protein
MLLTRMMWIIEIYMILGRSTFRVNPPGVSGDSVF